MQRLFLVMVLTLVACSSVEADPTTSPTENPVSTTSAGNTETPFVVTKPTATPTFIPEPEVTNRTTSGVISEDELWQGEIHLTGDIFLAPGVTLVVAPGTTVWLAPNSDDQHCCGGDFVDDYTVQSNDPTRFEEWNQNAIVIDGRGGTIYAIGTPDEPILFKPEGDSSSPAQWDGIYLEAGSIQHAVMLYGGHTVIQLIGRFSNSVEIAYNEIRGFLWAGIDSHRDYVWVHHNIVEGGGHQGIAVKGHSIAEFNVVWNSQTCISIESGDRAIVRNNLLLDCGRGFDIRGGNGYHLLNNVMGWLDGPTGWYYQDQLIYAPFDGTAIVGNAIGGNIRIQNNIIYNMPRGINLDDTPDLNFALDHNLVFVEGDGVFGERASYAGENLIGTDPLFVDWQNLDAHLLSDSPAIDAGVEDILDPDGSPSDLGIFGGLESAGWGDFNFAAVFGLD